MHTDCDKALYTLYPFVASSQRKMSSNVEAFVGAKSLQRRRRSRRALYENCRLFVAANVFRSQNHSRLGAAAFITLNVLRGDALSFLLLIKLKASGTSNCASVLA